MADTERRADPAGAGGAPRPRRGSPRTRPLEGLLARDAILAARMRQETTQHSQTLIEVSADPDWEAIAAAVAGALGSPPRLTAGEELSRQRRIENAATCRQIRLWLADIGVTVQQPYPFACECGRSTCALTVSATPDEYDVRRAAAPFAAEGHPETQRS